ncbi:MAG: hypothetical protein ABSA92_11655 [Candidatus Bathyarchaeia archaeon]|jgi:hypothetical protein
MADDKKKETIKAVPEKSPEEWQAFKVAPPPEPIQRAKIREIKTAPPPDPPPQEQSSSDSKE